MTKQGILDVYTVLRANYPNYHTSGEDFIALYDSCFKNFDDELVKKAVQVYIITETKGFAPSIGQVVEKIREITVKSDELTELEAWGHISRALKNSGYGYQEEFDKLPESVKAVVRVPEQLREWALMDNKEVETVVASNFMRSYTAKKRSTESRWAIEGSTAEMIEEE